MTTEDERRRLDQAARIADGRELTPMPGDESSRGFEALARIARCFGDLRARRAAGDLVGPHYGGPIVDWGPLRILERVGRGSFGDVHRAVDMRLDREVAVKLHRPAADGSAPPAHVFLAEARRLARVRHPNVVVIHGADVFDGRAGLWMEFIRGETLDARLAAPQPIAPRGIAWIGAELGNALAAVHAADLIHGDVKAGNVMWERGGRVVLMDFGSAHETGGGSMQASPLYAAPERLRGEAATERADLYALGVLLYRLVTGRFPYEAESLVRLVELQARSRAEPVATLATSCPDGLAEVIDRALAHDPRRRFASAAEMAAALRESLAPRRFVRAERLIGRSNLPVQSTRFIGRRREIDDVTTLLADAAIVTLTGPAGIGKTRLAYEVARLQLEHQRDGVWAVALARLGQSTPVAAEIATTLGIGDAFAQAPAAQLVASMSGRELLLVLDGADGPFLAPLLVELAHACPGLRCLITAPEALGIDGEVPYGLGGLSLEQAPGGRSDALTLFLDRVRLALPGLVLPSDRLQRAESIVRRLEGVPMAIELVAGAVPALTVEAIDQRLADRFGLLAGTEHALPPAATLAVTIEWAYDQLSDTEQRVLRHLSVFSGGWTLEDARSVCGPLGVESGAPAGSVAELATKAWIERDLASLADGVPRYGMLGAVASMARDASRRHGEWRAVAARHLDWCGTLIADDAHHAWDRLDDERCNLRAALDRSAASAVSVPAAMRLLSDVWPFWIARVSWIEALALARQLLALPAGVEAASVRARLLRAVGRGCRDVGRLEDARLALSNAAASSDAAAELWARLDLAAVLIDLARLDDARREIDRCAALGRAASAGAAGWIATRRTQAAGAADDASLEALREAARRLLAAADDAGVIEVAETLAARLAARGRDPEAATLLAAATARRSASMAGTPPRVERARSRLLRRLRQRLGEKQLEAAVLRGDGMDAGAFQALLTTGV